MKQIVAIVKPFLAEQVLESLRHAPLEALNVRGYLDQYSETEYSQAFLPKVEITIWVDDARVDETIDQITAVARTGRMGDGKVFVLPAMSVETAS
jgi:nitrogen regulatory protein PII